MFILLVHFSGERSQLGVDVDKDGLVIIDPANREILYGEDAVEKIIEDKRLTAVFYNAGLKSEAFHIAQVKIAYNIYYLPDKSFTVKEGKTTISGKIGDVLQLEAGKTAIVGRAVQMGAPGTKRKFEQICKLLIKNNKLTSLDDLAKYEANIIPVIISR